MKDNLDVVRPTTRGVFVCLLSQIWSQYGHHNHTFLRILVLSLRLRKLLTVPASMSTTDWHTRQGAASSLLSSLISLPLWHRIHSYPSNSPASILTLPVKCHLMYTSERHGAIPVISGDDVPPLDRPSPPLTPVFCLFRAVNPANPVVFFDISIGDVHAGRIKMELWADICPQTAENFRQFCTGEFKVPSSQSSHISALLSPLSSLLSPLSRLLLHDTLARIRIHSLPMMILISRSAHPRPHGTEPYPHSHLSA